MPNQIPLIVDRRGSVLTLSLNNPSKKNALNSEIMGALFAVIEETRKYEELRAIVIRGEGSVFCSGADVKNWKPNQLQILLKSIAECSLPTIAEVNGACLGGGMGLICACDFVVAKDSTHFGFPEVRIGMIPAVILPYVARKLTLSKIRELFITGERFDNSRAESVGILYHACNLDELVSHKIRMVIYANQSLRVAHAAMSRVLQEINKTKSLTDVKEKMSTMEQIFELQEMYNIKKEEEAVEEELKKLGYTK